MCLHLDVENAATKSPLPPYSPAETQSFINVDIGNQVVRNLPLPYSSLESQSPPAVNRRRTAIRLAAPCSFCAMLIIAGLLYLCSPQDVAGRAVVVLFIFEALILSMLFNAYRGKSPDPPLSVIQMPL